MRRTPVDLRRHERFRRVFDQTPPPSTPDPATRAPTGPAATDDRLVRNGGQMAIGTIVSRATGFLRTAVLLAALGRTGVADAYNIANASPNNVYDLLLGGILTAVIVPLLVRAGRSDADGGERFTSVLFTILGLFVGIASLVGVLAAPLIMRLYLGSNVSPHERDLAVTFTRLFLPQMLFYAMTALMGAVLNTRGRFGAVGFAPVVNNVIVIATGGLFIATADRKNLDDTLGHGSTMLLGLGTTAGVIGMTLALVPAIRAAGVRVRFIPDFREPRLRQAVHLGGWVLAYAAINQLGLLIITRLASNGRGGGDFTLYSTAYQVFQLPHAIIAVSVISALMPALSAAAADRDLPAVRGGLSRGLRLTFVFLVPAALGLAALANPIVTAALAHGSTTASAGRILADTLAVFAFGLPAFSAFQLLLRAFYAGQDSRTPALINVAVNVVNVIGDIVLISVLPAHLRVPGLAAGLALSYVVGSVIAFVLLRSALGGVDGARVVRLLVRTTIAALLAAFVARVSSDVVRNALGASFGPAIVALLVGAGLGGVVYVAAARRMRVRELTDLLRLATNRGR